jgi:hypothetical protein
MESSRDHSITGRHDLNQIASSNLNSRDLVGRQPNQVSKLWQTAHFQSVSLVD